MCRCCLGLRMCWWRPSRAPRRPKASSAASFTPPRFPYLLHCICLSLRLHLFPHPQSSHHLSLWRTRPLSGRQEWIAGLRVRSRHSGRSARSLRDLFVGPCRASVRLIQETRLFAHGHGKRVCLLPTATVRGFVLTHGYRQRACPVVPPPPKYFKKNWLLFLLCCFCCICCFCCFCYCCCFCSCCRSYRC